MSLLDAISAGLTASSLGAAGQQAGELEGKRLSSQLMSAALAQDQKRAQTDWYKSRANYYNARTPSADIYDGLRQSLLNAGNDPDDVDAAIDAAKAGNRSGLNALFAVPKPPASRILRTPNGYVRATVGEPSAEPIVGQDGKPVMPVIPSRGAGRSANPNAESPDHRTARQGLAAVNSQLKDDRDQLRALDKSAPPLIQYPGVVTGTPADSAAANAYRGRYRTIQEHADSLTAVRDRLAGQLTPGAAGAPPPPSQPPSAPPSRPSPGPAGQAGQPDFDSEAAMYKDAIANIRRDYAGDPAVMATRLKQASDLYNQRLQSMTKRR